MPRTLRDNEGVAADGDGDVMMPADETPSFEVVEAKLALHLFVHSFSAITFFEESHDLLLAHRARQRRERKLDRPIAGLFDQQPLGFGCAVDQHPTSFESRAEFSARS